ncbi:uncharacterized protein JCM15063_003367 [Sporobolomyces koalae]|uniref:uncharacterized protein n=1 Tax=Sporobolomyces koalae TaxID=500713 RepID=UPI0031789D70
MPQPRNSSESGAVAWPTILPPRKPLELHQVAPGILVVDHFLPPKTLDAFLALLQSRSISWTAPNPIPRKGEAARTNHRFQIQDDEFAQRLWTDSGLAQLCTDHLELLQGRDQVPGRAKLPCGLNGNVRCYRYDPGSYFGPHYDDDVRDPTTGATSQWTLLVYLTGTENGVKGGETAFYPNPTRKANGVAIVPELKQGRALLHRHGRHCSLHEGRLVEQGTKWVLRSDIMFQ